MTIGPLLRETFLGLSENYPKKLDMNAATAVVLVSLVVLLDLLAGAGAGLVAPYSFSHSKKQ